ncbi:MAG: ATP-binding cassette domain-containing protein [Actinobacteria bacterium]|uniref:Unannotated protein n=1 Tax=freshwater metagenome TaxID=449393 RepID=A0A6J7E2Q5_9ZZZZ|nr:ATP-binding cassette domain-containing protein [Actinomycetota bacterium]
MSIVTVARACVEFDGEHVLENVDLTIEQGEFIALLGPNGSGKTTLVRAILGLQPLEHGKIALFGTPLARFRDWSRIALVPQRLPGATSIPVSVWEAVLSGSITPKGRWRPLPRSARDAAQQALESVGLWSRRHDRLDALSGGQQRRVLIARALCTEPDLLVMDEPTAGLDAQNLQALTALLADLHHRGITIIVVTHELTGINDLVTRAVVLRNDHHESVKYDGPPPVPEHFAEETHHHDDIDVHDVPPPVGLDPA